MYICICNAVTETDIERAVETGVDCMQRLQSELGISTRCGACIRDAERCFDKILEKYGGLIPTS